MDEQEYAIEHQYLKRTVSFIDAELRKLESPGWTVAYRDTARALLSESQRRLRALEHARPRPYFGRVDFTFSDGTAIEAYVGTTAVAAPGERYVYDWRAPFPGKVYYADPNGVVSYEAPRGQISGTITRKRAYSIEDAQLLDVTEVFRRELTVTTASGEIRDQADAFLQRRLESGRTGQLQQAVATLQPEQYQQVAASPHQVMLVQGVAGSGKSIVGLHRIAYLLSPFNTGADRISASRILFFGPSRNFLRYVSSLLPSLHVDEVRQTTVLDWLNALLSERVFLDRREPLLEKLLKDRIDAWQSAGRAASLKGSLSMARALDRHVQSLRAAYLRGVGRLELSLDGETAIKVAASEISRAIDPGAPLNVQRGQMIDFLAAALTAALGEKRVRVTPALLALLEGGADREIAELIRKEVTMMVSECWPHLDFRREYRRLLSEPGLLHFPGPGLLQGDVDALRASLPRGETVFSPEDVGALSYLDHLLNEHPKQRLQHVVIDEAQEISAIELSVIRMHGETSGYTILGDLTQSLSPQGIGQWREVLQLFGGLSTSRHVVRVSYRSTYEITRYANRLLKKADRNALTAIPFRRRGNPPGFHAAQSYEGMVDAIAQQVVSASERGGTTGVLCKTTVDARRLHRALRGRGLDVGLLTRDETPREGTTIAPIAMTRGLEYDTVILAGVGRDNYPETPLHTRLLYVGASRAANELHVHWVGQPARQLGV